MTNQPDRPRSARASTIGRRSEHGPGVQPVRKCGIGRGRGKEPAVSFWRDDQGQGLVEYALIIVVIAIVVIVAMVFLRSQLDNQFSNIGNNVT